LNSNKRIKEQNHRLGTDGILIKRFGENKIFETGECGLEILHGKKSLLPGNNNTKGHIGNQTALL
jgi:hypothetical protein